MSVTPPKPKDVLQEAAAHLSRAAPNKYDEFVKAFEVYLDEHAAACVHAASDKVLIAQGRARALTDLSSLFINAIKPK